MTLNTHVTTKCSKAAVSRNNDNSMCANVCFKEESARLHNMSVTNRITNETVPRYTLQTTQVRDTRKCEQRQFNPGLSVAPSQGVKREGEG